MHSDDRSVPPKTDGDKRIALGVRTTGQVHEVDRSGSNDVLSMFTPSPSQYKSCGTSYNETQTIMYRSIPSVITPSGLAGAQ